MIFLAIAIIILLIVACVLLGLSLLLRLEAEPEPVTELQRDPDQRIERCQLCDKLLVGEDWWTVEKRYGAEEDDDRPAGAGGSMMAADFCTEHKPAEIAAGATMTHHG